MLGYISYVWQFFSLEDAHKVFEKIPQQYDLKPLWWVGGGGWVRNESDAENSRTKVDCWWDYSDSSQWLKVWMKSFRWSYVNGHTSVRPG